MRVYYSTTIIFILAHLVFGQEHPNAAQQPPPAAQQQQQQQQAGANINHLIDRPECITDIQKYCKKQIELVKKEDMNDMLVLECLQDAGFSDAETLTPGCEQAVWEVKVALTADDRFHNALTQFCAEEIAQHPHAADCTRETGKGHALSCMMDYHLQLPKTGKCFQFLSRVQAIAFTDFRLVGTFIEKCGDYVVKLNCGSLTRDSAHKGAKFPHSQGATLECLIENLVNVPKEKKEIVDSISNDCRHEVMRIAELQSDDFHLDRPLYFACRADREKFCAEVQAGEGKIFQCLLAKKDDNLMAPQCAKILSERAGLIGQDAHLAHPLTKACVNEMKTYNCNLQPGFQNSLNFHLSWLLLCLENGLHGFKQQEHELEKTKQLPPGVQKLSPYSNECQHEMIVHRGFMVQEFRMSPELVMGCAQEIDKFCSPHGDIEKEGKTIHCLMEHAKIRDEKLQLGPQCFSALQSLMKVADIGSNYRVDKVLWASCQPLIEGKCKMDAVSEAGTLTCLMKFVDTDEMTDVCEQRLVEVQYFMARDWTLDPQLYEACHQDAVKKCSATDNWHMQNNPDFRVDPGPQVLACLYRSGYDDSDPLTPECSKQIHSTLRARAVRVNLIPEIEEGCRDALSEYCSSNTKPQEEMNCLQEHFETKEFKTRHDRCYKAVYEFTKMESKDTKLNRLLTRACRPVIDTHCSNLINEEIDHGDVMECLSQNKEAQEMTPKCRSYVHHFELISMRDYHFNYKFSQACESDIKSHCASYGQDKGAIIRCLSNIMFEHRVLGENPDISKDCKRQLKQQYLQQEKVDFDDKEHMKDADPTLMLKCDADIKKLSCNKEETFEGVIECLREGYEKLTPDCKAMVFDREKIEAMDNTFDDELMRQCSFDLKKFCGSTNEGDTALRCLSNSKVMRILQPGCQKIVHERLKEQSRDDRLRPGLLKACEADAKQYCQKEYEKIHNKQYGEQQLGSVITSCLRAQLARFNVAISQQCKTELSFVILETEFDIALDPMLYKACKETIPVHCSNKIVKDGGRFETVLECLKADFYTNQIQDQNCAKELARVTQEALVDIHLDPILHEACSVDIQRICRDIPPGQSRIITCLNDALEVPRIQMSDQCKTKLMERKKLWNVAHDSYQMQFPDTFAAAYQAIATHPQRDSILAWFGGIVLVIMLLGCCCGRWSKRTSHDLKNR